MPQAAPPPPLASPRFCESSLAFFVSWAESSSSTKNWTMFSHPTKYCRPSRSLTIRKQRFIFCCVSNPTVNCTLTQPVAYFVLCFLEADSASYCTGLRRIAPLPLVTSVCCSSLCSYSICSSFVFSSSVCSDSVC